MDNGRLRIENCQGVMYCEAYLETEYGVADILAMAEEARRSFAPPVDVILRKAGSYSLSIDGQRLLSQGVSEFRRFVYVVDNATKRASAEYAAQDYMQRYQTRVAGSKEEALALLAGEV